LCFPRRDQEKKKIPTYSCIVGSDKLAEEVNNAERCREGMVSMKAISVTFQIVTCNHPPAEIAAKLYGCPITIQVDQDAKTEYMPSKALYREIVKMPEKPKYRYCACLLVWYRAEFLHEWLWYHTKAHGLQKTWIYDNDSVEDDLPETSSLLAEEFNIEYVPWHTHKVQLAYHGHCATLAGRECEWVSFTDVDEFVYVDPNENDGRLYGVLENLETEGLFDAKLGHSTHVGGIEARMVTMSAGDVSMIRQPEGGVLRNYQCTGKSTNWKSIIRPRALHFSLCNAVHYYAYDSPAYVPKRYFSRRDDEFQATVRFYHYKNQAWEIYMRKYIRRASPVTSSFKLRNRSQELSPMRPDAKWEELVVNQCTDSHQCAVHGRCAAPAIISCLFEGSFCLWLLCFTTRVQCCSVPSLCWGFRRASLADERPHCDAILACLHGGRLD
jgi:hypothetical protein